MSEDPVPWRPLRIGLLHQYRLDTSGSGVYLGLLAGQLLGRGHHVSLMSHDATGAASAAAIAAAGGSRRAAFRAHTLRGAGTPVAYPRTEEPDSVLFSELPDPDLASYLAHHVDRVTRAVERDGLDVLHANSEVPMSYVAAMVSRRTGVPYVTVAHGSALEYVYRVDPRYRSLCRVGLREAAGVVVLNSDVRGRVLAVAPEVADRVRVVPPGVDCSVFRPVDVAAHGPTLAYVGRISADKGAFLLVGCLPRLLARTPGARLVVVGDGPDKPHLERFAAALGCHDLGEAERVLRLAVQPADEPWVAALIGSWQEGPPVGPWRVTFTGQLPPAQVAAQMAAADAVVVPSLVREAFPLVVLEALASGAPPVAVDTGGLGAVLAEITPRLGKLGTLLALPADPVLLVRHVPDRLAGLLAWMGDPRRRNAARSECRSLAVDTYSWGRLGAQLESIYREAVAASAFVEQPTRTANV